MLRYLLPLLLCLGFSAQAQRPFIEDFVLSGDTYLTDDFCFRLTEAIPYRSGSIWYKRPISLAEPFSIELSIMVGCDDMEGADGMVFVFTPQAQRTGYVGEGMGFAGLRPSIGIEIDTWRNYHLNDPAEDHIAIMANGRVGHQADLAGPTSIANIEDCTRHRFFVRWDPAQQKLWVEIDGEEVIAATGDIVNLIFGGSEQVYWGMTAATGRAYNIHEVCFDRIGYLPGDSGETRWGE